MNGLDVSAFSVYSLTRRPKLLNKRNMKLKLKRKKSKKLQDMSSLRTSLVEVSDSSGPGNAIEKRKKKLKRKFVEILLHKKEEIISNSHDLIKTNENIYFDADNLSHESDENFGKILSHKKPKKIKNKAQSNKSSHESIEKHKKKSTVCDKNGDQEIDFNSVEIKREVSPVSNNENELVRISDNNSDSSSVIYSDSVKVGEEVLSWLLSPLSLKKFFKNCWEQKPLHIKHNNEDYFKCICTLEDFKETLKNHDLYFTKNIDVTSYINGERTTENPEGKAKPAMVWDFYRNGKSIRFLNPQTFIPNIHLLNSTLQEFFHCFVGANIYLTPPGTQGFAPHYDDIEAFVLQLEGEKHWKLYNPRSPEEVLPRESSRNFKEDEIGEPIMEVTLQAGDLLYFPRGIIHQARCLPHVHSLHITVSCYQRNSWADLMEKVLPVALQLVINEDVEFRKGLPLGCFNSMGLTNIDSDSQQKQEIKQKFNELFGKILNRCPLEAGMDQLGANYAYDALPPWITEVEKLHGAGRDCKDDNFLDVLMKCKDKDVGVKLIRATSVRLVAEEDEVFLYYTTDNSLVYHEHESSSVKIPMQWTQAIETLIHAYPKFVKMKELPLYNHMNKPGNWKRIVDFVYFLWQKGLLLFDQPIQQLCR